jgi:hypothetical protein
MFDSRFTSMLRVAQGAAGFSRPNDEPQVESGLGLAGHAAWSPSSLLAAKSESAAGAWILKVQGDGGILSPSTCLVEWQPKSIVSAARVGSRRFRADAKCDALAIPLRRGRFRFFPFGSIWLIWLEVLWYTIIPSRRAQPAERNINLKLRSSEPGARYFEIGPTNRQVRSRTHVGGLRSQGSSAPCSVARRHWAMHLRRHLTSCRSSRPACRLR